MRFQPKSKYKRIGSYSALDRRIRAVVEREAKKFNCSKSFVIAVALAEFFKIPLGYDYE